MQGRKGGHLSLWSMWPNSSGKEAQAERQPAGKPTQSSTLKKQWCSREAACLRQSPRRETPSFCGQGTAPASQPSSQSGRLKLSHPICSSGSPSVICYAFAPAGGKRGGIRGQSNSKAFGRHMSSKIKAEVM